MALRDYTPEKVEYDNCGGESEKQGGGIHFDDEEGEVVEQQRTCDKSLFGLFLCKGKKMYCVMHTKWEM